MNPLIGETVMTDATTRAPAAALSRPGNVA